MSAPIANRDGPVLIMAGGTGGHIFPGLAVADELVARKIPVVWFGAVGGLETQLVPRHGLRLETLPIGGLRGKGLVTKLVMPFRLAHGVVTARALLRQHAPRSAISMGGYAAAPGGIAAHLAKVPLIVHEQNRIAGMTNRLLAARAQRVLTGFADVFPRGEWVGNPVRASIAAIAPPAQRYAGREGPLRLLVLGGSQGAQSLNAALPEVLRRRGARLAVAVRHQCGTRHFDKARTAYMNAGIEADSRGRIPVDKDYRTKTPNIFAVGDVIGFPSLASVSMEQGRIAVARAFNDNSAHSDPTYYPYGIYTIPEISFIGKTEEQLTDEDVPYEVGVAYYREIARGQIRGDTTGRLKIVFHRETRHLLGVHIIGEGASELLHIGQAVMALGGRLDYFIDTVFNYPTLAEAYKTAAFNGINRLGRIADGD